MSRVKNGPSHHKRVKKVLKQAKGYRGRRSKLYHSAKDAVMRALSYAYRDRRRKKRDFRRLWIMRINAAMEGNELKYGEFINGLKKADIRLNRKVLSNLAYEDPEGFKVVIEHAKAGLK